MGCKPSKPSSPSPPSKVSKSLKSLTSTTTPNKQCQKHYTRISCEKHLSQESPCHNICTNGNDCSLCRHMRDSRRAHVDAVLKRVNTARNFDTRDVKQRDLDDGEAMEGEASVESGDVEGGALEDGMVNAGLEEDIADHNVWA